MNIIFGLMVALAVAFYFLASLARGHNESRAAVVFGFMASICTGIAASMVY